MDKWDQLGLFGDMMLAFTAVSSSALVGGAFLGQQIGAYETQEGAMALLSGGIVPVSAVVLPIAFSISKMVTVQLDPNVAFPNEGWFFEDKGLDRFVGRVIYHWLLPGSFALTTNVALIIGYVNAPRS